MGKFYSLYFNKSKFVPSLKEGIQIELKNNIAYLDGVCSYRVFVQPQVYEDKNMDLEKLFFLYPNTAPWIAKEEDGNFYLYKGSIDEYSLNLKADEDEEISYMSIELEKSGNVSLDEGRVITRLFKNDKQYCIIEIKKDANIIIYQGDLVTILDWNGEKLICK